MYRIWPFYTYRKKKRFQQLLKKPHETVFFTLGNNLLTLPSL